MNWLLKITEGPMRGAEIALVDGSRVTFGKGDGCDIVIADAALANEAFSLDVSSAAVTLVTPDGSTLSMNPFETRVFGATEFAVGPSEGVWENLRPASAASEAPAAEPEASEPVAAATPPDAPPTEVPAAAEPVRVKRTVRIVLLVVLLLAVLGAAWFCVRKCLSSCGSCRTGDAAAVSETAKLRELASANGLDCVVSNGVTRISGNLAHRTERLALRALALSVDPYCALDVSDDESFRSACEALLFTVTEGAIKVVAATNRALSVTGYAPNATALVRVEEALRKDVPWLLTIRTALVRVGGRRPPELDGNYFVQTGQLANRAASVTAPVIPDAASVLAGVSNAVQEADVAFESEIPGEILTPEDRMALALIASARLTAGKLPRGLLPVAGILTRPYPCVVLQGGQRLVEGAKVQGLEIRRIEAARVTFGFRKDEVIWEP